ncbi:hypothetical protein ACU5JM_08430 [Rhodococcus erythropolis]|uniref:hypothetical protein n=1 Tax=Rhodococcus erythropolis TaxID=1833 RepID=UPI00406B9FD8
MLKKIGYSVGLLIGILLVSLLAYYLFALATGTTFNETQWAAAGAWFGGLMTFGAVSVAIWQTNNANQQARDAEQRAVEEASKAELRHKAELAAADARLANELDAQRRHDQAMAISPMWNGLVPMSSQLNHLVDVSREFARIHMARLAVGSSMTDEDCEPVIEQVMKWNNATSEFDLACNNALMLVTEEKTSRLVAKLYVEFRLVQKEAIEFAQQSFTKIPEEDDHKRLMGRLTEIRLMRRQIIRSVRENIMQAEWLDLSVDGVDPFET